MKNWEAGKEKGRREGKTKRGGTGKKEVRHRTKTMEDEEY